MTIKRRHHTGVWNYDTCVNTGFGYVCERCAPLNTTLFYDLEVPLPPSDWGRLYAFLRKDKWSEKDLYHWTAFWVREVMVQWRFARERRALCFFVWRKFLSMGQYQFFRYLYEVIMAGGIPASIFLVDRHGGLVRDHSRIGGNGVPNTYAITTCHAMIALTIRVYKTGGRVVRISTQPHRHSIIQCATQYDAHCDRYSIHRAYLTFQKKQTWRQQFQQVVDEIDNEVRFRPGMCGMEESRASFQKHQQKQVI